MGSSVFLKTHKILPLTMTQLSSPSATVSHVVAVSSELLDGLEFKLIYTWAGVACLALFIIFRSTRPQKDYDLIPAASRTGAISSYLDAIQFTLHGPDLLTKAYAKYQPGIFRVPEITRWHIVVSGPQLVDELRKAPADILSSAEAIKKLMSTDWTFGPGFSADPYHISVVRNQLTQNLGNFFPELWEEIVLAFDSIIPATKDWTRVNAYNTTMKLISRISNRIFVGAPLCRDPEFTKLTLRFAGDVIFGAVTLTLFPDFLKPIAGRLFTNVPKSTRVCLKHLKPLIEERMQKIEEYGPDYPGKPVDILSWLMDEAQGEERTPENLTRRILSLNFSSLHTSSITFTNTLFNLASHPEYIEPIREEVEAIVAEHGWTKVAINRMRKLDSFLKESQRFRGVSYLAMTRMALAEFTFSNGTRIPKGAFVSAIGTPRQLDDEVYTDAKTFNGFRFSDMGEREGMKNQLVTTSNDFLLFGHGKHACPGRFFAAQQLKAMVAHIVLTYDLKMTDIPRNMSFVHAMLPDSKAEVWFRKRHV